MSSAFNSPKALIKHAREDLLDLKSSLKSAFDDGAYDHVVDREPDTGYKRYKICLKRPIPSRAAYTASNILNAFRHALDQATVASIREITGTDPGVVYFPLATCPADLKGRLRKCFPLEIHAAFEALQPYPTGNAYIGGNDFLCTVTKITGPNKHQITLSPRVSLGPKFSADAIKATGHIHRMVIPPIWDSTINEMIIATVADDCELHYNFLIEFYVALGNPGPMFRHPVLPVLDKFGSIADHIVASLEAEIDRILRERV